MKTIFFLILLCNILPLHAKSINIWHSGYKIKYDTKNTKSDNYLSPQFIDKKAHPSYIKSLYNDGYLTKVNPKDCKINHLILGLDQRGPLKRSKLKTFNGETNVNALASRADSINLISINRCSYESPKIYSLYRGNYTPETCIPAYFKKGKTVKKIILGNFFLLAGRKKFISCVKSIFSKKINNLNENVGFNELNIHNILEIKLPKKKKQKKLAGTRSSRKKDQKDLKLSDYDKLSNELKSILLKNFSIFDLKETFLYPLAKFFIFEDVQAVIRKIKDRSKMQGSGYERAMIISNLIYASMSWLKVLNEKKPNLVNELAPIYNLLMSSTMDFNELKDISFNEDVLNSLNFDLINNKHEYPIIVFGAKENSYFSTNTKNINYFNLGNFWVNRLDNINNPLPMPSNMN